VGGLTHKETKALIRRCLAAVGSVSRARHQCGSSPRREDCEVVVKTHPRVGRSVVRRALREALAQLEAGVPVDRPWVRS